MDPKKLVETHELAKLVAHKSHYRIGDTVKATVTGIQQYGVFVKFGDNTKGLIHISEIKSGYISSIKDYLAVNEQVRARIIDIDDYSGKISLSIRCLDPGHHDSTRKTKKRHHFSDNRKKIGFNTLKAAMPQWIDEQLKQLAKQDLA